MAQDQTNKRTKIKTVLSGNPKFQTHDGDPLLLMMAQGSEAISSTSYLDVVMLSDRAIETEITPKLMINTPATVSLRVEDRVPSRFEPAGQPARYTYTTRQGRFQTFIRQDRFHRRFGRDFNVYAGRIVPTFQLLDQEVRYRIFEDPEMTFCDIMDTCIRENNLNLAGRVVMDAVRDSVPKMEHCVQYGESTFNFLSRLMNRFSIWYYYDHLMHPDYETLVLGTDALPAFGPCTLSANYPDPHPFLAQGKIETWQIVTGLSKIYTPAPRRTRTSDFNTIVSTQPIQSLETNTSLTAEGFDIISTVEKPEDTAFVQESFPDSTVYTDADADKDAQTAMQVAEGQVFTVTGVSKNPTFYAGRTFVYMRGEDNKVDTTHLVTRLAFNAYDRDYLFIVSRNAADGLAALLDDVLVQPGASFVSQFGSGTGPDLATAMAAAGMSEAITSTLEAAWGPQQPGPQPPKTKFGTYYAAGMMGYLASFLPNLTSVLQDILPVIQIAAKLLLGALNGIVDAVIFIPALFARIAGQDWLGSINKAFASVEKQIALFIEHLLFAAPVDAYSSTFISVALDATNAKGASIRPLLPTARNAQIFGPHLATVIGDNGIDVSEGEIWADKLGRVRVRFPWDREPVNHVLQPFPGKWTDGKAKTQYKFGLNTAWLRVSDAWAGDRFGTQFLPRIGDEVIVSFIDSDPDRPIITGRVYNARGLTFPNKADTTAIDSMQDLRKLKGSGNFKRSGLKTRSTPSTDSPAFHMLRFDDTAGKEQLLVRSQARLDVTALGTKYETLGGHYNLTVGWLDPKHKVEGGNYISQVFGNYTLHVGGPGGPAGGGHRYELVEETYELHVKKDLLLDIQQKLSAEVAQGASISAGSIVLEASDKITLKVGSSWIVITPAGVYSSGPIIGDKSGGSPDEAAAVVLTTPVASPARADAGTD